MQPRGFRQCQRKSGLQVFPIGIIGLEWSFCRDSIEAHGARRGLRFIASGWKRDSRGKSKAVCPALTVSSRPHHMPGK